MQPDRFRVVKCVSAMLLAIAAAAVAVADEPFMPRWSPVPFGPPRIGGHAPAADENRGQESLEQTAGEMRKLFLTPQSPATASVERPAPNPIREPSRDDTGRTATEMHRLFLAGKPPAERAPERRVREPVRGPVKDPGYPRLGSLVRKAEEPAGPDQVPAIGTAALIKSDADLSKQKIKAIKYLATAGCECSSQSDKVRDALLSALDDCNEDVRYEAALAFCRSAGNTCSRCNRNSCCDDEVMDKLRRMAEGRDAAGCWYEPAGMVRAAARRALDICGRVRRQRPSVTPGQVPEMPSRPEDAPGVEAPEQPDVGPGPSLDDQLMGPIEPSLEELAAAAPGAESSSMFATPSPTGTTLGMIGDFLGGPGRTTTISLPVFGAGAIPIGPTPDGMYSAFQSADGMTTFLTPGAYNDLTIHTDASGDGFADTWILTEAIVAPGSSLLNYQTSNRFPLAGGSEAVFNDGVAGGPPVDGDITSGGGVTNTNGISYDVVAQVHYELPPSGIRSLKIAENNSTLPRDRLIFNYSFFRNVMTDGGRNLDVNRFVFGFEKILDEGMTSFEARIPFASTLNSDQRTDGVDFTNVQFGNVGILLKRIIRQGNGYAFGGGLGISFPTADDARLFRNDFFGVSNFARPDGTVQIMHLNNEAYHLMPWLGLRLDPSERLFVESFLQIDVGLNENRVYGHFAGPQYQDGSLPKMGQVYDQAVLLADVSVGYWLHRDRFRRGKLMGVVPNLELHYASALQDPDMIWDPNSGLTVNSQLGRFDHLNLTVGTHFVFHRGGNITPAIVVPLKTGDDRQFDYEFQLQTNVPF